MSNVSRPKFSPANGSRIRYADSPVYDPNTGSTIVYGEDRSNPAAFDQTTGLPIGTTATVNVVNTAAPVTAPATNEAASVGSASVTKIADSAYETPPVVDAAAGLTIRQIRSMFGGQLSLTSSMIALVNGEQANETDVVEDGDNVVFKEPAKRRG